MDIDLKTKIHLAKSYAKDIETRFVKYIKETSLLITSSKIITIPYGEVIVTKGNVKVRYSGIKEVSEKTIYHVTHISFKQNKLNEFYVYPEDQITFSESQIKLIKKYGLE
jgi:hypothetical protein